MRKTISLSFRGRRPWASPPRLPKLITANIVYGLTRVYSYGYSRPITSPICHTVSFQVYDEYSCE